MPPAREHASLVVVFVLVQDVVDGLARLFLHLLLRLAEALADLPARALHPALGLQLRIVEELARLFLDVALRLLGLATDLVTIHKMRLRFRTATVRFARAARPLPAAAFRAVPPA